MTTPPDPLPPTALELTRQLDQLVRAKFGMPPGFQPLPPPPTPPPKKPRRKSAKAAALLGEFLHAGLVAKPVALPPPPPPGPVQPPRIRPAPPPKIVTEIWQLPPEIPDLPRLTYNPAGMKHESHEDGAR